MIKKIPIRAFGIIATILGIGASVLSEWVNEKAMDEKIEKKVNEALANRQEDEEP